MINPLYIKEFLLFSHSCGQLPTETTFNYQSIANQVYRNWCLALKHNVFKVKNYYTQTPYLPISFFKTHKVVCHEFEPELIFESSGTTQTTSSKHFVKLASTYKISFLHGFEMAFGNVQDFCVLGLLPSYLERQNSSLVYMVNELINLSNHPKSGFYLYDFDKLHATLIKLEAAKQKTVLFGVTFALLDFAAAHHMHLKYTTIIETGGMKGRQKEITKTEVHEIIKESLGVKQVHSEYGMTELLSQAYTNAAGRFVCPPWMKVLVRDEDDPMHVKEKGKGAINIFDLANMHSCSFIATDDVGEVFKDGSFSIYGRLDASDLRGCSLLLNNL